MKSLAYLKDLYKEHEESLELPKTEDEFDDVSKALNNAAEEQEEEIFNANVFGNGYAPETSEVGQYEPQKLNARHREILRLAALGYKNVQIARILSITPVNVSYVLNSSLGQSLMTEIQEARTDSVKDVHNRLQEMSPFAAEVLMDIMADGKSESNKLRAAETVLKATGHSGEQKHLHLHSQLSQEEIHRIKHEVRNGPEVVEEAEEAQVEQITDGESDD